MAKYPIIFLIIFVSCQKEKQKDYETIVPLSYLPVYPGSSWTYLNENGDTVKQFTLPEYQLHSYKSYKLFGNNTDKVYVPFWNGVPVYGYSSPLVTTSPAWTDYYVGLKQVGYLSETPGQSWVLFSSQYEKFFRTVVNIDTTVTVNTITYNHVITVYDSAKFIGRINFRLSEINYFAKDVGLIQQDIYNDTAIVHHLGIISYFINH